LENLKNDQEKHFATSSFEKEELNMAQRCKNLSLRKLQLWIYEPFERLKWMAIIADACKGQKGGRIISIIMCYNKQGNKQIQALINRILKHVLVPLIHFIKRWIYYGEVNDPYDEFFIKENTKIPNE